MITKAAAIGKAKKQRAKRVSSTRTHDLQLEYTRFVQPQTDRLWVDDSVHFSLDQPWPVSFPETVTTYGAILIKDA